MRCVVTVFAVVAGAAGAWAQTRVSTEGHERPLRGITRVSVQVSAAMSDADASYARGEVERTLVGRGVVVDPEASDRPTLFLDLQEEPEQGGVAFVVSLNLLEAMPVQRVRGATMDASVWEELRPGWVRHASEMGPAVRSKVRALCEEFARLHAQANAR